MNFFRSYPEGGSSALGICIYYVLSYISFLVIPPYPNDMPAAAWRLGITYPQSIKRLGHFLTADCKSAGTPNGGRAYPALQMPATAWRLGIANPQSIKRLGHFLTADCKSAGTPTEDGHIRRYGRAYPAQRKLFSSTWLFYEPSYYCSAISLMPKFLNPRR